VEEAQLGIVVLLVMEVLGAAEAAEQLEIIRHQEEQEDLH
jgi:hypothetical protein